MHKVALSSLIAYNFWANNRILTTCERVSTSEFVRAVTPDPGWHSLREILVHALDAEYGWRCVLQSHHATAILDAADFPDVAALRARWQGEQDAWLAYVDGLSEDRLQAPADEGTQGRVTVWQMIMHVIMHGAQHRSEAAAILTGYGQSPGEIDYDMFLQENTSNTTSG